MSMHIPKRLQPVVDKTVKALATANDGVCKPAALVAAASAADHPLHDLFEWDDAKAAHEHRLWQARQIIATVTVTVESVGGQRIEIRAMRACPSDIADGGGYREVREIMKSAPHRDSLIDDAIRRLKHWRDNYRHLTELRQLITAIDEEVERIHVERRGRRKKAG